MNKNLLVLIDGNAIVHRAFHALPPLTTKKGELVNAVYGFSMALLTMLQELAPEYVVATFDLEKPTFRHKEYAEYKAKRVKAPDELYNQIPRVKEILNAIGIPVYEKEGFEADDIIGTICEKLKSQNSKLKIIIVTGDLDTLQLVDENVRVYTMRRGITDTVIYDIQTVREKYGLLPEQLIDYKGLRGDPSDNIPGVPGIGEKTASQLISKFGNIENLYKNLNQLPDQIKKTLATHKKEAEFSKKLSTINKNVKIKLDLEKCRLADYDRTKAVKLFQELEFRSLLAKLPKPSRISVAQPDLFEAQEGKKLEGNYKIIRDQKDLERLIEKLKKQLLIVIDCETDFLGGKLIGMSFSFQKKEAFYLVFGHKLKTGEQLDKAKTLEILKPILEDTKIKKAGHNLKYDYWVLRQEGIETAPLYFDTMVASYLVNPHTRAHNLDQIAFTELGYEKIPLQELVGIKKLGDLGQAPLEKVAEYSCEDADITLRLVHHFTKRLKEEKVEKLFFDLEMPLVPILARMEEVGIKIDTKYINQLNKKVTTQIKNLHSKICQIAGEEFNINSTQQLRRILFEKLGLATDGLKRTKTGHSTAASELEKMRGSHKIIDLIFEYRELAKLKNTYLDALPALVDKDGRVHTSFNQTVTATGRLSSSDPNLQNIPIRTPLGQKIRRAFVADEGKKLISADYSQIELRIAASIANDKEMIKDFAAGKDIHAATAAEIFDIPIEKVTKAQRRIAKTVNFGVLYGLSPFGLAQSLGIERDQAKAFIERYFEVYRNLKRYVEEIKIVAAKTGYVETLLGRRRYLPEINSGMAQVRMAAERMAINMPIQGTAADIMKMAMININSKLKTQNSKLLLQVHDELVFEVPKNEAQNIAQEIKEIMESVFKLKVPLKVEVSVGDNWGEMRKLF